MKTTTTTATATSVGAVGVSTFKETMNGSEAKDSSSDDTLSSSSCSSSSLLTSTEHVPPSTIDDKPQVIIITGPTAAGKTYVGVELALRMNGEVVSADSVQVYKGLNIGTGKVTKEGKRGIPHHLIDIYEPDDDFSAGTFAREGRRCIKDIIKRGKTPIVVGGTGFYLRWLIHGIPGTPKSTEQTSELARKSVRDALKQAQDELQRTLVEHEEWNIATQVLRDLGDAQSAESIPRNNYYQLYRAIEIIQTTGNAKQSFGLPHRRQGETTTTTPSNQSAYESQSSIDTTTTTTSTTMNAAEVADVDERTLEDEDSRSLSDMGYDVRGFVLSPPRILLYEIIDKRAEDIILSGIFKECALLAMKGMCSDSHSSTRAIGYRQGLQMFEKVIARRQEDMEAHATAQDVKECILAIMAATRNLASKQLSWHRGDTMWKWHPCFIESRIKSD